MQVRSGAMDLNVGQVIFAKESAVGASDPQPIETVVPAVIVSVIALVTIIAIAILLLKRRRLLKLNAGLITKPFNRKKCLVIDKILNTPI